MNKKITQRWECVYCQTELVILDTYKDKVKCACCKFDMDKTYDRRYEGKDKAPEDRLTDYLLNQNQYWYYYFGRKNGDKIPRLYEVYHFKDIEEDMNVPASFWKAFFKNPIRLIKHLIRNHGLK
jgi:hypothetical protein